MQNRNLKILADENMPMVEAMFSGFGKVTRAPGRNLKAEDVANADVLLVRSITQVNAALLDNSSVIFVGTATIGTDHIDQNYLVQNGIGFSNAPGCNADAVVEYVLSCIYALAEKHGFDPKQRTYGIIGVGNVGGRLEKRFKRLGFKVLLNDPPRAENEEGFVPLNELLEQADVICLHTPLIRDGKHPTQHLLSESELRVLKPGCLLINAGRGPAIDNQALLTVGEERPDLLYVLDVWEFEPAVNRKLAERCEIVSPHIAGYSLDGKIRGTYMLLEALCRFFNESVPQPLANYLPESDLPFIEQESRTPLSLMQLIYDPYADDQRLRETLGLESDEQRKAFDLLRKNYPVRREFGSMTVLPSDASGELAALGFQIAD